ncbi:MAG: PilT/PilU family type 4a pilus ATPase [Oscillospiraceae bacterium]
MDIREILKNAVAKKASDIIIICHQPVSFRINGAIIPQYDEKLTPEDTQLLLKQIFDNAGKPERDAFVQTGDSDFSLSLSGVGRFRVNAYRQRNSFAAVIRSVMFDLPLPSDIGIPPEVMRVAEINNGFVLVTGAAGSGKSTTLACLVDKINSERNCHIITLEDPVEYIHRHKCSIVSQREIHLDTISYETALRAALRQSPDVILLGEMRDFETIRIAMTAAETGHLLLSSLHTNSVSKSIDRIIDVFSAEQQQQIRMQLSMVLQAVVSQQLLPSVDGGLVPAFEIMLVNPAIRNMIRSGKVKQIDSEIHAAQRDGMVTMDASIQKLLREGKITEETAQLYLTNFRA